jgi:hypothetical protein
MTHWWKVIVGNTPLITDSNDFTSGRIPDVKEADNFADKIDNLQQFLKDVYFVGSRTTRTFC